MKKIISFMLLLALSISLSSCSFDFCDNCGKPAFNGRTILGKYLCDDCFGF